METEGFFVHINSLKCALKAILNLGFKPETGNVIKIMKIDEKKVGTVLSTYDLELSIFGKNTFRTKFSHFNMNREVVFSAKKQSVTYHQFKPHICKKAQLMT